MGTFAQADTWEGDIYHPQTLNAYFYTLGNPFKYTDPSGHSPNDSLSSAFFRDSASGMFTWNTGSIESHAFTPRVFRETRIVRYSTLNLSSGGGGAGGGPLSSQGSTVLKLIGKLATKNHGTIHLWSSGSPGGKWLKPQFFKDGTFKTGFKPDNPDKHALYQFLQAAKVGNFGWHLDYGNGAQDPPFYMDEPQKAFSLYFSDRPETYNYTDLQFVLSVVSLTGKQQGRILGLMRWVETTYMGDWSDFQLLQSLGIVQTNPMAENQYFRDSFDDDNSWFFLQEAINNH